MRNPFWGYFRNYEPPLLPIVPSPVWQLLDIRPTFQTSPIDPTPLPSLPIPHASHLLQRLTSLFKIQKCVVFSSSPCSTRTVLLGYRPAVPITRRNFTKGVIIHQSFPSLLRITSHITQSLSFSCLVHCILRLSIL